MAKTLIVIEVHHLPDVSPEDVCGFINKIIDVGQADALDSAADENLSDEAREEADSASILEIGTATVAASYVPAGVEPAWQRGDFFTCPNCGSSYFGSTFDQTGYRLLARNCHDEFEIGCTWSGIPDNDPDKPAVTDGE